MSFNATRPKRLTGSLADLPAYEQAAIITFAEAFHIPPEALAAVRLAENGCGGAPGEPSRAFGVLSLPLEERDEYGEQLHLCAQSIANAIVRFERTHAQPAWVGTRLRDQFFEFMAARWAPVGAANDPQNLNSHWVKNVLLAYRGGGCEWT